MSRATEISKKFTEAKEAMYGFDLTDISGSAWADMVKEHGLKGTLKSTKSDGMTYSKWIWKGKDVTVISSNDPISGKPKGEKDYASYIGVKGNKDTVDKIVSFIKAHADGIKGESPGKLDFIDEDFLCEEGLAEIK